MAEAQMLRALDPEYQAQWDEAERRKALAEALLAQAGKGVQIQQSGPVAARISPLAMMANMASTYFANKARSDAGVRQSDLMLQNSRDAQKAIQGFQQMAQGTPDQKLPAPIGSRDEPNPENSTPVPGMPGDINKAIAAYETSRNPAVAAYVAEQRKRQQERVFKFADLTNADAPKIAAEAVKSNAIPTAPLPDPKAPEIGIYQGANGPVTGVTNYGPGQRPTLSLQQGGTTVNIPGTEAAEAQKREQEELTKAKTTAQTAMTALANGQKARQLLSEGAQTGSLGEFSQNARKIVEAVFGVSIPEKGVTDELASTLARQLAAALKPFGAGTGVSDRDVIEAKKVVGSLDTDPVALLRLIARSEAEAIKHLNDFSQFVGVKRRDVEDTTNGVSPEVRNRMKNLYNTADIGIAPPKQIEGSPAYKLHVLQNLAQLGGDPSAYAEGLLSPEELRTLPTAQMKFSLDSLLGRAPTPKKTPTAPPKKAYKDVSQMTLEELQAELAGRK